MLRFTLKDLLIALVLVSFGFALIALARTIPPRALDWHGFARAFLFAGASQIIGQGIAFPLFRSHWFGGAIGIVVMVVMLLTNNPI